MRRPRGTKTDEVALKVRRTWGQPVVRELLLGPVMTSPRFSPVRNLSFAIVLGAAACGGQAGGVPGVAVQQSTLVRDTTPTVPAADATQLAGDNQAFAVDMYQQLRGQSGNLIFSPISISVALAMLYNGAADATATQIAGALHFTLPIDRLNAAFDAMDLSITTPPSGDAGSFQLSLANSTWADKGLSIVPSYLDTLAVSYGSSVNTVDFATAPDVARTAINQWVSNQTQGQIPTLFGEGSIDSSTRLVLADAVYFHGDWQAPFDPNSPPGTFHASAGDVSVPMMVGGEAMLWTGTGFSAASLAYKGGTVSMVVVAPDAGTFDTFEAALTADQLSAVLAPGSTNFGEVSLPRFKFQLSTSLDDALSTLGMPDAFGTTADFSGIDGATDLYVDQVVHQAVIAVDEKGTTAAAATGIGIKTAAAEQTLVIDRPFLFFIVHQPTGAVLFAGRVVDPSQTN
jgi:serpin B